MIRLRKKLKLSRSGYYDYLKRKPCKQKIRKEKLAAKIKKIHKESREICGALKIAKILQKEGNKVSEKYAGNIMREHRIKAHYIKPYTVTTKDCDFSNRLKNILKRDYARFYAKILRKNIEFVTYLLPKCVQPSITHTHTPMKTAKNPIKWGFRECT